MVYEFVTRTHINNKKQTDKQTNRQTNKQNPTTTIPVTSKESKKGPRKQTIPWRPTPAAKGSSAPQSSCKTNPVPRSCFREMPYLSQHEPCPAGQRLASPRSQWSILPRLLSWGSGSCNNNNNKTNLMTQDQRNNPRLWRLQWLTPPSRHPPFPSTSGCTTPTSGLFLARHDGLPP